MHLTIYSSRRGDSRQINLLSIGPIAVAVATVALAFTAGYFVSGDGKLKDATATADEMREEIAAQQAQLATREADARANLDALAVRMGQLSAHIVRLDALGRRLVSMADLADSEFNFDEPPARGGPETEEPGMSVESEELDTMLDELALQVDYRGDQLAVLEKLLASRRLSREQLPEGRPVSSGWLSSYYGKRTDPFSGKQKFHSGVDFAGNEGVDVLAVASGVVTWSGKRSGYGTMVEINHGNGLVTRYAHNKENLVEVGDTVKKGQVIGRMGKTGRATGPHVHFEVLKNGQKVNPLKYVQH
jgi:murein DD-endopeptidase MepM/ murein hydrolase activator NlpD